MLPDGVSTRALIEGLGERVDYREQRRTALSLRIFERRARRGLDTAFQFCEPVGVGVNFGDREQYGVGVRIQHISNGSIKEPNDGVTFGELAISYRWD